MPDDVLVTSFDTGPTRQRRRSSAGLEKREVRYVLTRPQMDTLRSFVRDNAGRSFWWPDPTHADGPGTLVYARMKGGSNVKFEPYGNTTAWQTSFTIEIWPWVTQSVISGGSNG